MVVGLVKTVGGGIYYAPRTMYIRRGDIVETKKTLSDDEPSMTGVVETAAMCVGSVSQEFEMITALAGEPKGWVTAVYRKIDVEYQSDELPGAMGDEESEVEPI